MKPALNLNREDSIIKRQTHLDINMSQSLPNSNGLSLLNTPLPPLVNLSRLIMLTNRRLKHQDNRAPELEAAHLLAPPQSMTL